MTWKDKIDDVYRRWEDSSDHFTVYTSGSTGHPKKINLAKQKMRRSAEMSISYFGLGQGDRVLLALPADKIGGIMLIVRSIVGELELVTVEPKLNPLREIDLEKINFCSLTPAQLATIFQDEESREKIRKIDQVLLGGSDIPSQLLAEIKEEPNTYFHSYGMTETISHVAIKNLSDGTEYFEALEGVEFEVNKKQQLIIHAPTLFEKPLTTNDVVALIDEKKMVWKGRVDNVVNSGGVKLIVEEIEQQIRARFSGEFYLMGEDDAILGQRLIMVSKSQPPELDFLPKHHRPKKIYLRSAFRYTGNGKLMRISPHQLSEL